MADLSGDPVEALYVACACAAVVFVVSVAVYVVAPVHPFWREVGVPSVVAALAGFLLGIRRG